MAAESAPARVASFGGLKERLKFLWQKGQTIEMTWEEQLQDWAKPPGVTEQTKCENAERACRKAIAASRSLAGHSVSIIQQGSYRNRTNGGIDSDVDICVLSYCPMLWIGRS